MCGIAGFTHFDHRAEPGVLERAVESLRHRGPNQQGIFESPDVSLGAVRLKIIDLEGGNQPFRTDDGEYTIAFNGEIYNHQELRRQLEDLGHRFHSHCDTEVVLRAFAQWDVGSFARLRGMFAAGIWQASRRRLVLVRDRLGIKPLYYRTSGENVAFGSELKAIFADPNVPRRISYQALGYFLSLNYVPGPYTLVDGIRKIPPGTWLECREGKFATGEYWRNAFRPEPIDLTEASEELNRLLESSISEHLISDVPLGIWASGGLDSSTILHYAAQAATRKLQTFSISFQGRRFDESQYFRLLAERYGTVHRELDLNSDIDLPTAIHDISYYSDEPSADAGAVPVWFLSRMTASEVTVALSGEGADEIFGGYQTYLADRYAAYARRVPSPLLRSALALANRLPVSDEKIGFEYKLKRFLSGALLPADEAHFHWNGTFLPAEQRNLGLPASVGRVSDLVPALDGTPDRDIINRYLFVDQHYYLPDDILYKCDRMSMAHSLEVRPPFLDHRIVEFAARLPSDLKVRGSSTKHVLRALVRSKLPPAILQRRKEGLDIPAHEWLRGPLRPLMLDALGRDSINAAGLFKFDAVQQLVSRHLSRQANLGYHLWGLITIHLWLKRWRIETGEPTDAANQQHVFSATP